MKISKRLLSLFIALTICICLNTMTAIAAEQETVTAEKYVVVSDENTDIMPITNDYVSAWIPAGKTSGYFEIEKTFSGQGHVTIRARSDDASIKLDMNVARSSNPDNSFTDATGWVTVTANDSEVKPETAVSGKGTYYVHYKFKNGNPDGTFLMCWIYG